MVTPKWLELLLSEKFFNACLVHELEKKNDENIYCLDCCLSLCLHCLPSHKGHKLLQIRRYVCEDVLRLKDAKKVLDCSLVQSYTTNGAKVVFLNQRPITRQFKDSVDKQCQSCIVCQKILQRPNLFCSISCKVQHKVMEGQKTPDSISSSVAANNFKSMVINDSVKTEHTSVHAPTSYSSVSGGRMHRRKGVPKRSPLF